MKKEACYEGSIELTRVDKTYYAGYCIIQGPQSYVAQRINLLSEKEQEYYETLKFEKRKESYLLGRVTAKTAIYNLDAEVNLAAISVDSGIFHFPVVKGINNVNVSITHCDGVGVAIAFPEEHPIAVDLEKIDLQNIETMHDQFCEEEITLIKNCGLSLEAGYTSFWTVKEGISKILKCGLTIDLKLLRIQSLTKKGRIIETDFQHFGQYKGLSYCGQNYILSIITPKNTKPDLTDLWDSFKNIDF